MAKGIKTREVKKDIRALDKAGVAAERMKNSFVRTKDEAMQTQQDGRDYASPTEYAEDRITDTAHRAAHEGVHQVKKQGGKILDKVKDTHFTHKETKQTADSARDTAKGSQRRQAGQAKKAFDMPREQMKKHAQENIRRSGSRARHSADRTKSTVRAEKTIKQSARASGRALKATAKGTVKTVGKSIKTAERTAKTAIKTTQEATKLAQRSVQAAAKAAKIAAQTARAAAKTAAAAAKAVVKATIAFVKMAIAAIKALVTAIAAGGWVAVVIILVICLIGLLLGSVFGIFFSGEDSGTGQTMQTVVREINTEYDERLEEIKNGAAYDVLEMSGSRAVWKEVLAVYSVKTTTDPDNPQEVATMDEGKKELLTDIFWEMNEISSRTESKTETVITESDDGHGNIVETETTVTQIYLYITVSHKTAEEMADQYAFNTNQQQQLSELLAEGNNSLWSQVLYGISYGDGEIVSVALSQVGNVGGQPYWSWYGFNGRVEWCACFISWCANECGYIEAGIIPKFAGCVQGSQWFKDRGQWQDSSFEPSTGHIIFFDWEGDGSTDHVGIVEKCENGVVYTVEGNSGDACRQKIYAVGSSSIYGYGIPAY